MTPSEFEQRLAQLRRQIAEFPSPQREALESLALETLERHGQVRRASLEGRRAIERLELAFERLRGACDRLRGILGDARDALTTARTRPGPGPGLN